MNFATLFPVDSFLAVAIPSRKSGEGDTCHVYKVVIGHLVSLISRDEKKCIATDKGNLKLFYEGCEGRFPDLVFTNPQK